MQLDIVEMDPSVVRAAEEYFEYQTPDQHRVYVEDARVFLRKTEAHYDVVWVDVFARHMIPFHLTTQEFFAELRSHLTPDGVVAVNLASSDSDLDRMRAEAVVATMKTSFPHVETFSIPGPSWLRTKKGSANLIFFASTHPINLRSEEFATVALGLLNSAKMPPEVLSFLNAEDVPPWNPGLILTDDFSPFDILQGSG